MTEQWMQPDLPFDGGLPPDRVKLAELAGCAVLVAVGGMHSQWPTKYDPADAVRINCVVLNGPRVGEELIDVMVFNAQPLRRLRAVAGRAFVGHIDVDDPNEAKPAVLLLDPSPEEYEMAAKWHAENPQRTAELVSIAVASFNSAEANRGRPQQQRPAQQQQQRSSPPTGPNYGQQQQQPSSPPPNGPPPAPRSAQLPTGKPFDTPPADLSEPPF